MLNSRKNKVLSLLVFSFILFFIFYFCFKDDKTEYYDRIYNKNLVLNVLINNQLCAYDTRSDLYYYSSLNDNYHNWKIKLNSLYKLEYTVENFDSNIFIIHAYNNNFYQDVRVVISNLPIIELHEFDSRLSKKEISRISTLDINSENKNLNEEKSFFAKFSGYNSVDTNYDIINLKVRGSSSVMYPKKSYKLSFDKKIDLYDLPRDDKYVLDAAYVDKSMVRNLLSTNLWNLINDNQKINNDLSGKFVELFIDNEYVGLYVLKDKVDKSVTQISDSGILLKSISHMNDFYITKLLNNDFSIENDVFLNFEIKKFNNRSFSSFVDKLKKYYSCYSYECIDQNFDINNYINYMLFVSILSAQDNINYNSYLSLYDFDSKILITPWDMDLTWGLNLSNLYWKDDVIDNFVTFESCIDINWMNENITKNMDVQTLTLLKHRYWELRKDVITMDTINNYLNSYKELLVDSGAALRDSERWYEYDVEFEIEQIREWASRRIQFLDEYFK